MERFLHQNKQNVLVLNLKTHRPAAKLHQVSYKIYSTHALFDFIFLCFRKNIVSTTNVLKQAMEIYFTRF